MRAIGLFGITVLLGLAWLLSNNRRRIRVRVLFWGMGLQLVFALTILARNDLSYLGLFLLFGLILLQIFLPEITREDGRLGAAPRGAILLALAAGVGAILVALEGTALLPALLSIAGVLTLLGLIVRRTTLARYAFAGLLVGSFSLMYGRGVRGHDVFRFLSDKVSEFLQLTDLGTNFMFGKIVDPAHFETFGFQFAFKVLPTIIFFACFMSILYHIGVMQFLVETLARFMRWTMGTSGAETLSCSANVFVGQTEAPLLIKPFLPNMTLSELLTVMVGGFATIAGGVLAGYIAMGVNAGHLIAASVMSAPAALVVGKIIYPETLHSETAGDVQVPRQRTAVNLLDAAAQGVTDGLKLAANVGAMLIAFIALIGLLDVILNGIDALIDGRLLGGEYRALASQVGFSPVKGEYAGIFPGSIRTLFGNLLRPLAFVMGVSWDASASVGNLLGIKVALNEFVAYGQLREHLLAGDLPDRAVVIATYALCGFANFSSIGIQLGGIGAIAPTRRGDLAKVALKAMAGGAIASFITATIAGMIV